MQYDLFVLPTRQFYAILQEPGVTKLILNYMKDRVSNGSSAEDMVLHYYLLDKKMAIPEQVYVDLCNRLFLDRKEFLEKEKNGHPIRVSKESIMITPEGDLETMIRSLEAMELRPGESVVDVCSNGGGYPPFLALSGARVYAVDMHYNQIVTEQRPGMYLSSSSTSYFKTVFSTDQGDINFSELLGVTPKTMGEVAQIGWTSSVLRLHQALEGTNLEFVLPESPKDTHKLLRNRITQLPVDATGLSDFLKSDHGVANLAFNYLDAWQKAAEELFKTVRKKVIVTAFRPWARRFPIGLRYYDVDTRGTLHIKFDYPDEMSESPNSDDIAEFLKTHGLEYREIEGPHKNIMAIYLIDASSFRL